MREQDCYAGLNSKHKAKIQKPLFRKGKEAFAWFIEVL
jgi:hypothetical protein